MNVKRKRPAQSIEEVRERAHDLIDTTDDADLLIQASGILLGCDDDEAWQHFWDSLSEEDAIALIRATLGSSPDTFEQMPDGRWRLIEDDPVGHA
jgi:hypothetical protein